MTHASLSTVALNRRAALIAPGGQFGTAVLQRGALAAPMPGGDDPFRGPIRWCCGPALRGARSIGRRTARRAAPGCKPP